MLSNDNLTQISVYKVRLVRLIVRSFLLLFFFFQAEDGIRDLIVTGVQTCALPIFGQRDLLIEHLHLIQDKYGHLSAAHLVALAQEMKLALAEVYEVATFYAHFDVVRDPEQAPPAVTVRVCDSLSCAMAGAEHLLHDLPHQLGPDVRVVRAPCMGACDRAPVCAVGHVQVLQATPESVT